MPHQDRDHDLMHGKDHRRGGAGLAEHVAHVNHVGHARALAAELDRDHHAEQALRTRGREGFTRKARVAIDGIAVFRRRRRDDLGATLQVLRAGDAERGYSVGSVHEGAFHVGVAIHVRAILMAARSAGGADRCRKITRL
jgi:hypothetical protein